MKKSLMAVLDSAAHDPGRVQNFCRRVFEFITVDYVSSIDKIQIACFDIEGRCRMVILYQWWMERWWYDVYHGTKYHQTEGAK